MRDYAHDLHQLGEQVVVVDHGASELSKAARAAFALRE
jgi:hypothetical protein